MFKQDGAEHEQRAPRRAVKAEPEADPVSPTALLGLQRTAGNATVARMLADQPQVQRYVVVHPGEAAYPVQGTQSAQEASADFFPAQERIGDSYVDAGGEINLRYRGAVPLRISAKRDLAIEDSGSADTQIQAKAFFATERRIAEANANLKGLVTLAKAASGNFLELRRTSRFLKIKTGEDEVILWQVEPVVTHDTFLEGRVVERGLDVRLAQRCNEIATSVSGRRGLPETGVERYFAAIADVLGELTDTSSRDRKRTLAQARNAVQSTRWDDPAHRDRTDEYTEVLAGMIQETMALRDTPGYTAAVRRFKLDEFTPPPQIGDVLMIKALREDSTSGSLDFHFGAVVARSGGDYITMENFARHAANDTLSSGDPQWYFQMYGTEDPAQSWHREWDWAGRFQNRLVLSILIGG
ncbi:hypothetical protein [Actinokineospora iranica]|uniref:Uncharacterized protein n=1 Tax=Actinokineospora iranica TaxID=1271860 RepID=A0A1G6LH88_9PSEU|nr:hypothetical protein [Actinokineospora iranica]SDC42782.1 hypothetical protein SAMN05216174_10280 [Actinokineospora iranica]